MPQSHQEPFWSIAMNLLPAHSELMQAVSEYLYMRIQKNPQLSVAEWETCIKELVDAFSIKPTAKSSVKGTGKTKPKARQVRTLTATDKPYIMPQDLSYYFIVATRRKWNHVYFTREQDRAYSDNISFYQNPYWQRMVNDPEIRKILEAELNEH